MSTVYISLGSNLGDRAENISRAVRALTARGVRVSRQSLLYETEPVDVRDGGWFLNGVVQAETQMKPQQLMQTLLIIERSLGGQRRRGASPDAPKESRTMDMDVLLFGADVIDERDLQIPHPRMAERKFVLVPLAEIAGGVEAPGLKKTVAVQDAEPVQCEGLGVERVEFDFGQAPFGLFAPAINAGFGFFLDVAGGGTQEIAGVVGRGRGKDSRPRHRFDHVTAQKLRPVGFEELRGSEDVAPGDFGAESHDDSDHALALQAGSFPRKSPLDFFRECIH